MFTLQKANPWPKLDDGTTLEVRTVPDSAQVQIDDLHVGMSDGLFPVKPGRRQIRVRKVGFLDATVTVEVAKGKHLLQSLQLQSKKGAIELTNTKSGDEYWLGPGIRRKVKLQELADLSPGFYEVWATRDSRVSERLQVNLGPEQKKKLALQWLAGQSEIATEAPATVPPRPIEVPSYTAPPSRPVSPPPVERPIYRQPASLPVRTARQYPPPPSYMPQVVVTPIPEPAAPRYYPDPAPRGQPVPAPIFTPVP